MRVLLGVGGLAVAVLCLFQVVDDLRAVVVHRSIRARLPAFDAPAMGFDSSSSIVSVWFASIHTAIGGRVHAVIASVGERLGLGGASTRADRALLVLLETTTRRLRSGSSLRMALADAARGHDDDDGAHALAAALDDGDPLEVAIDRWAAGGQGSRPFVATALVLAGRSGGAVAGVLDGVAAGVRDRLALEREVAALSSQARASAALLVVAPVGFTILMSSIDGRLATMLLGSPLGWACLITGVLLDLVGALWMARLLRSIR